jgi:hypothetical protein
MVTLRTCSLVAVCVVLPLLTGSVQAADTPTVQVRICIPPRLVTEHSWDKPVAGSDMAALRNLIRDYVAADGGSGEYAYWIVDDAFERFVAVNGARYPPDPKTLVIGVSARYACPETNYTAQLEVDAVAPAPVAQANQYSNAGDASPAPTDVRSGEAGSDDGATIAVGVGAAAALWCMATNCLGGASDESAPTGTDYEPYDPPPYDNAYQQVLEERHNACVWAHTDISDC